jgi:KaiC/GvpD/RAD55 family RecA-like ATPase
MPRIPLLEDLTAQPIPPGSVLLVVFDPSSQWYNAIITIAAGWLKQGGKVSYSAYTEPPEGVRFKLSRLGVNAAQLEMEEKLIINDWYTTTLGEKSKEKHSIPSLKVSDLSLMFSQGDLRGPPSQGWLNISDNTSTVARFNDEKSWVEYVLTRPIRMGRIRGHTMIRGLMDGVHSGWVYKQLESAHDGIIDFKFDETRDPPRNQMRIRTMRNVPFDGSWHQLRIDENFQVTLEK